MDRAGAADGSVCSLQRLRLERPVVPFSIDGARELGRSYWSVVERSTLGAVRQQERADRVELRLFGWGPVFLRFGEPRLEADVSRAACHYPIEGGLLARRPGGWLSFEQVRGDDLELRSTIAGFHPRLAVNPTGRHWRDALYKQVQSRIHEAIGRRYLSSLRKRAQE